MYKVQQYRHSSCSMIFPKGRLHFPFAFLHLTDSHSSAVSKHCCSVVHGEGLVGHPFFLHICSFSSGVNSLAPISPYRSISWRGLFTYEYVLTPPSRPIGSLCLYPPMLG